MAAAFYDSLLFEILLFLYAKICDIIAVARDDREQYERNILRERRKTEEQTEMSNTVKIKNKKKKKDIKVNYKLWAIIFGIFVAVIVVGSVWGAFHWGVGMGTIGKEPMSTEDAGAAASEIAAAAGTDAIVLTPEQLEEMGYSLEDLQNAAQTEGAGDAAAEDAGSADAAAEDAAADAAAEETEAESN